MMTTATTDGAMKTQLTDWAAAHLGEDGDWVPASAEEFADHITAIGWEGCGTPYERGGDIWLPVDFDPDAAGGFGAECDCDGDVRITEPADD